MIYPWHQIVWQQLNEVRQSGCLPHALLFSGQDACGHFALVETLAQALLCTAPDDNGFACGRCRSCQVQAAAAHPDFLVVQLADDKQVISVDQIRELTRFLELSCSYSPHRIALLPHVGEMNMNAANSLLKSLEEPAANTHILMFTTHPANLLPTILSRCQHFRLLLPRKADSVRWLEQQNPIQSPEKLLKLAYYRPLAALEQDSGAKLAEQQLFAEHLLAAIEGRSGLAELSAQWEKHSRQVLLDWQLRYLHEISRQQANIEKGEPSDIITRLQAVLPAKQVWTLYDQLLDLKRLAAHPLNARLFVENMLALWVSLAN